MRVLVVGVGAVGARAARQLLSSDGVDEVLLRDPDAERLDAVRQSLGAGARVAQPSGFDRSQMDLVVLALPPGGHVAQARLALSAKLPVVSAADSIDDVRALLDLDSEARERRLSVIVGAGFGPGLSCLLAAHGSARFDHVDEIHVARVGTGGPACARQHHRALGGRAVVWRDGGWVERRGGSGRELCWFPDPVGAADCYRAALPDAWLLVDAFPGVGRVTARLAANRRNRLTARWPRLRPPHAEGGPGAIRVEVRGRRDGATAVDVLGAMDRPAVAAGAVAAVAGLWLLQNRVGRVGASGLAGLVEPVPFLHELHRRGVRAATFVGAVGT
jgi:saccharopine dehydrogenase-like NADP-dependent oxidoreductase